MCIELATSYTVPCKYDNMCIYIILSGVQLYVFRWEINVTCNTLFQVSVLFLNLSDPLLYTYGSFEIP